MIRPYILGEATLITVRDAAYDVAILPWGATEAHNLHLPYATDVIESDGVAAESARLAWDKGARVVVLPAIPFGVNTGQLDVPFCINMNPSTQAAVLGDVVRSLAPHGIRKLVILNGHGGNDFRQIIRELQPSTPIFLCAVNWYASVDPETYFDEPGDHAGELETSTMMTIAPDLVAPLSAAGSGHARRFRVRALREGWAWAPRHWTEVTDDTGIGNPARATADKGRRFFDDACRQIADFLVELAQTDPNAMYE
ncbi:MAG TPA: creatininase family protein [Gemmatimonadaceae bacterium]|nr:creatininase family protein [Gemmatimonadaceae bacterium]